MEHPESDQVKSTIPHDLQRALRGLLTPIIDPNTIADPAIIEGQNTLIIEIIDDLARNLSKDKVDMICKIQVICDHNFLDIHTAVYGEVIDNTELEKSIGQKPFTPISELCNDMEAQIWSHPSGKWFLHYKGISQRLARIASLSKELDEAKYEACIRDDVAEFCLWIHNNKMYGYPITVYWKNNIGVYHFYWVMRKLNGWMIGNIDMTEKNMLDAFPLAAIACCFLQVQDVLSDPSIDLYKSRDPYKEIRRNLADCMEFLRSFADLIPHEKRSLLLEFVSYAVERGRAALMDSVGGGSQYMINPFEAMKLF